MKQNNILLRPRANQYWLDTKTAGHNNIAAVSAKRRKIYKYKYVFHVFKASQFPSFHVPPLSSVYYISFTWNIMCGRERALMPEGYYQNQVVVTKRTTYQIYMCIHSSFFLMGFNWKQNNVVHSFSLQQNTCFQINLSYP